MCISRGLAFQVQLKGPKTTVNGCTRLWFSVKSRRGEFSERGQPQGNWNLF